MHSFHLFVEKEGINMINLFYANGHNTGIQNLIFYNFQLNICLCMDINWSEHVQFNCTQFTWKPNTEFYLMLIAVVSKISCFLLFCFGGGFIASEGEANDWIKFHLCTVESALVFIINMLSLFQHHLHITVT